MTDKAYKKEILKTSYRETLIYCINLLNNPDFQEFNEDIKEIRNDWISKKITTINWDKDNRINKCGELKLTGPILPVNIDRENIEYIFYEGNIPGIDDNIYIDSWQSKIKEKFNINKIIIDYKNGENANREEYRDLLLHELHHKKNNSYDKFDLLFKLKKCSFIMELYLDKVIEKKNRGNNIYKFYKNLAAEIKDRNIKKINIILKSIFVAFSKEELNSDVISNIYEKVSSYDKSKTGYEETKEIINNIILELKKEKININEISQSFQKILTSKEFTKTNINTNKYFETKKHLEIIFGELKEEGINNDVLANIHKDIISSYKNKTAKKEDAKKNINEILLELKKIKINKRIDKISKNYKNWFLDKEEFTESHKAEEYLEIFFDDLKEEGINNDVLANIHKDIISSYKNKTAKKEEVKNKINKILLELKTMKSNINIKKISALFRELLDNDEFNKINTNLEINFEKPKGEISLKKVKIIYKKLESLLNNLEDKIKIYIEQIICELKQDKIDYLKINNLFNKIINNKKRFYAEKKFAELIFYEYEKEYEHEKLFVDNDKLSNIYNNIKKNIVYKKNEINFLSEFRSEINYIKFDHYNLFDFYLDLGNYLNIKEERFNNVIPSMEIEFKVYSHIFDITIYDYQDLFEYFVPENKLEGSIIYKFYCFINNYYNELNHTKIEDPLSEKERKEYRLFKRSYLGMKKDIDNGKTNYEKSLDYQNKDGYIYKFNKYIIKGCKIKNEFKDKEMIFDFKRLHEKIKIKFINLIKKWSYPSVAGPEYGIDEINRFLWRIAEDKSGVIRDKFTEVNPLEDPFAIFLSNCIVFDMKNIKDIESFFIPPKKKLYDLRELIVQFKIDKHELEKLKEMIDNPDKTKEDISEKINSDSYKKGKENYKKKLLREQESVWSYPGNLPTKKLWNNLYYLKKEELEYNEIDQKLNSINYHRIMEFYNFYIDFQKQDFNNDDEMFNYIKSNSKYNRKKI
ncbi:hypothetical protein [Halanaerobium hydrogeniformans]|uniref:Uncharacterized protein n=1 Tax=Halanaerobium hydrogeniformans TaxID=656519 RepID=E4RNJ8_HALHG|nr:hypothetical protein [Halanaerobium hydrogeniformans]ADQ13533.1 hypothetical protein Halsa_0033 [Halanaerobium hydrogeniformans]